LVYVSERETEPSVVKVTHFKYYVQFASNSIIASPMYRTCYRLISAFVSGLYPQIGWRVVDEVVFIMEGASHDTGSLINWAQQIGNIIAQNFIIYWDH
jgi:hypothetical protein